MKTGLITLLLIAFLSFSLTQSSTNDCETYYPIKKGMKRSYEEFNKKGKLISTSTTFVKDINSLELKTEYIIEVSSVSAKPKKDEKPFKQDLSYICENGVLSFDMKSVLPQENMEAIEGQTFEVNQSEISIPKDLKSGQVLNDGFVSITMNGFKLITVNISNRKVEKTETITTDAGTFDCALITYDTSSKIAFMTIIGSSKQWFSDKVGIVKSESFDRKGKLMSSQKLKAYSN